jgi:hypothetical protein
MNEQDKELAIKCRLITSSIQGIYVDTLQEFADLIRADEREACAKECKKLLKVFLSPQYSTGQPLSSFKERHAVATCIESIRARGAK